MLLTVNYSSSRDGLFSILKELTNQRLIIANEPPLNYIRVSIIQAGALQPLPPWAPGLLNLFCYIRLLLGEDSGAAQVGTATLLKLST